jgi:hypothetical protein
MRLFGVSWTTVIVADMIVLALLTAVIYVLLRRIAGTWAAVTACAAMLCAYGFSQYGPIGNNSLIAPFSHECTHGLLAAFVALWAVSCWISSGRRRWLGIAGVGIGLTLLGKTEIAAATSLSCMAALGVRALVTRRGMRDGLADAAVVAAGVLAPIVLFLPIVGVEGVMVPWRALLASQPLNMAFHQGVIGIDRPGENISAMLWCAATMGAVIVVAVIAGRLAPTKFLRPLTCGVLAVVLTMGAGLVLVGRVTIVSQVRMLPVAMLAILLWSAYRVATSRGDAVAAGQWIVTGTLAMFSFGMLMRMLLNVVVYPYGFELAMPATVVTVAFLAGILPDLTSPDERARRVTAGMLVGVSLVFALACVQLSAAIMSRKTQRAGPPGDAIICTPRDAQTAEVMLGLVESEVRPGESLMVIPEGVIINYWTRRTNSTPHYNFVPLEMAVAGGEDRIVADMQARPPDVIIGIPSFTARVYGFERFGVPGFGDAIMKWIVAHYARRGGTGPEADAAARLGIVVLRRRPGGLMP